MCITVQTLLYRSKNITAEQYFFTVYVDVAECFQNTKEYDLP